MALTVEAARAPVKKVASERVIDFSPATVAAPFFLRCAALCIDYMLMMSVPVLALIGNKFLGDGSYTGPGSIVWTLVVILWVIDFLLLPLLRGQTLGKMLTGITILRLDGTPVNLLTLVKRNVLGYAITAATLGIGYLSVIFSTKGRALHDIVAGTVVVRGRRKAI